MKFTRGLLIFSYGLFSIAAQTLLFREFITTFEGNDISVGIFFSSWFLWIGLGAILVRRAKTFAEKLLRRAEFLFLAYVPAFILQAILIIQARELAGIESYGLWSIREILLVSIVVNAPVSLVTGILFPIACRWVAANSIQKDKRLPVSRVYTLEAAGSFVGGLGMTILLGLGVSLAGAFFIIALVLSLSVLLVQLTSILTQVDSWSLSHRVQKTTCAFSFLVCLSIFLCLIIGADTALMHYVRLMKWTKLLPKDALSGSFNTAQAEYLYGVYQGQWLAIREGSVAEALPDESAAGQIAAIGLCQKPDAKKILIIGSSLGLCHQLLRLPQLETVTWAHCDSEYIQKVGSFIPDEFAVNDQRLQPLAGDVRSLLAEKQQLFDIVFLNLPEATSSVLNRFYTLEFYRQVKESLSPNGVLAVRIAGGENIMGTELINLGASTKLTLEKVFSQLVLTPGEDTWFIASDSEGLTGEPGILRDRFAAIPDAEQVFKPEALLSVYLPDRAEAALKNYSQADLPENLLINRDSRPLTHLYSLLLTAKQSGTTITRFIKNLALAGPLAFLIPLIVLMVLRAAYVSRNTASQGNAKQELSKSSFDSSFLVFSAGWVGIGVTIVLMYLYQTRFGSLYLHIGIISSLFMVGLTIGAVLISHLVSRLKLHASLLFTVILFHILILAAIAFWQAESLQGGHLIFAIAFVLCGLCTGCYFPIAAMQLADAGFETGQAGGKLETADHIGASVGGSLTSLMLVPVLGARLTLFVFAMLILANTPTTTLKLLKREKVYLLDTTTTFRLRRLGYVLFGIGISVILCSNLLADVAARLRPSLPQHSAQALAGELRIEPESTVLGDSARRIGYFNVYDANDKITGYIFSSEDLAPQVRGFGGKINLAIFVGEHDGRLLNFHIIRSNETPTYLELLSRWYDSLIGRRLFQAEPFADVHAVTGATVSSEAILSALQTSSRRFAGQILGRAIESQAKQGPTKILYPPDTRNIHLVTSFVLDWIAVNRYGAYLIGAFLLTLIVIYHGGFWSRLAVLIFNLVLGGIILNAQYSTEQIVSLLSGHIPALKLTGAFLLVIAVPILVVIFGNIYCGYICPFGAVQELLGYIIPERIKQPIQTESMRKARFIKYIVLFVLIIVFFLSRNRTTLAAEPLISIFNFSSSNYDIIRGNWTTTAGLLIVAAALIGSLFYTRFWCRYLCPAGAFLSLLNNVAVLKRYLPTKKFGRCEFGLTVKDQMDCIYCDRCRYTTQVPRKAKEQVTTITRVLIPYALAAAILISSVSIGRLRQVIPVGSDYSATLAPSGGQPRDVDMQRIQTLIEQKRLSYHEAEFYEKVE